MLRNEDPNRLNRWESKEQFEAEIQTIQRFPVDSSKFYNTRQKSHDPRMMVSARAGEQMQSFYGLYTIEEVKKVFMEAITEYEAALILFTDWDHWKDFSEFKFNKTYLDKWRVEKEIRDRLKLSKLLWKAAENGSVPAQKALLEEANKNDTKPLTRKGQALQAELEQKAKEKEVVQSIKDSLFLATVNGKRQKA